METRLNDVVISRILALYTRSRMTRVLFALSRISRNLLRLPESHPFPGNPRDAHPPSADAAESARSGKRLQSTATNIRNLMRTPAPLRSAVGPANGMLSEAAPFSSRSVSTARVLPDARAIERLALHFQVGVVDASVAHPGAILADAML